MISDPLPDLILEPMVRAALLEDFGAFGDVTARAVIPTGTRAAARMVAREAGVLSGMQVAALAFRLTDPDLVVTRRRADGDACAPGDVALEVEGSAASILAAERVALNFAGRLSGIATLTSAYARAVEGTGARVTCTRKTTPGLRLVEKLAVAHGGGSNHRLSLSDAVMIKDNHIAAAGGVRAVLRAARERVGHMTMVEIEVDTLDQLAEVLDEVATGGGAQVVLLDNMGIGDLTRAVEMVAGRMVVEASGGVTLDTVGAIAATGVDYVSSGALTHSARVLDLGLDF